MRNGFALASVGLVLLLMALFGCVHTELIWRDFEGETLYVEARVAPNAKIDGFFVGTSSISSPSVIPTRSGMSTTAAQW